jgi:hypothetical protein
MKTVATIQLDLKEFPEEPRLEVLVRQGGRWTMCYSAPFRDPVSDASIRRAVDLVVHAVLELHSGLSDDGPLWSVVQAVTEPAKPSGR